MLLTSYTQKHSKKSIPFYGWEKNTQENKDLV